MRVFSLFAALILVSCANLPNQTPKQAKPVSNGLDAQELAAGECGVFLWTIAASPSFIYFHKNGSAQAQLFMNSTENALKVPSPQQVLSDFGSFHYEFMNELNHPIIIKGEYGAFMEGGRKIPSGSIQFTNQEGWQEIIPVSGVYVCR